MLYLSRPPWWFLANAFSSSDRVQRLSVVTFTTGIWFISLCAPSMFCSLLLFLFYVGPLAYDMRGYTTNAGEIFTCTSLGNVLACS